MSQATTHPRAKLAWLLPVGAIAGIVYGFASAYFGVALQTGPVSGQDCTYRLFLLRDRVLTYISLPPSFQATAHSRLLTIFRETRDTCQLQQPAWIPMLDRLAIALEQQNRRAAFIHESRVSPELRAYQEPFPWPIFPLTPP